MPLGIKNDNAETIIFVDYQFKCHGFLKKISYSFNFTDKKELKKIVLLFLTECLFLPEPNQGSQGLHRI